MARNPNARLYRSFVGHLVGTKKAAHTVRSYESDLKTWQAYLEKMGGAGRGVSLRALSVHDLQSYGEFLRALGLSTNTRRRKLMTVRKLLRYLRIRKQITLDVDQKIPAPAKLERVPALLPWPELWRAVLTLGESNPWDVRNKLLLLTLVETGCRVSELSTLSLSDFAAVGGLRLGQGSRVRAVPVSADLVALAERARKFASERARGGPAFLGFNRFGPLDSGGAISDRGVELVIARLGAHLGPSLVASLGNRRLTPRLIRSSRLAAWLAEQVAPDEIQRRLGLKSAYSLRVYGVITPTPAARSTA